MNTKPRPGHEHTSREVVRK
ncbi:hypothetical protein CCACVL1_09212 [Corchorus capsularis]|uniref:Uncharacterized protein n=1 Tax=Corchorus capsularis TaxID=210143 RepID=A0A1R3IX69_COCAP|nr:hypothetical protein CCACVL1_09212 [Corchorus capsularis]